MVARPTSRKIVESGDLTSWLSFYPPDTRQPCHAHQSAQLSFLLSGCFSEESGGRELHPIGQSVGLMPVGESHSVRFGKEGALVLSVNFAGDMGLAEAKRDWRKMDKSLSRKVSLIGGGADDLSDLCSDLLAGFAEAGRDDARQLRHAPKWLRLAVKQLTDDPEIGIGELAAQAGVHRVYLSRMFLRFTGLSPTEYRLARKCAAAVRLTISDNSSIALAAVEAGFADQSHWNRVCRALSGIPPGRIRQLMAG